MKHVFKYLNHDNVLWVDVLIHKYGYLNFWSNHFPPNYSVIFRGLYTTANVLKPNCWINNLNPGITSMSNDPWCFDIPLAFKPTFINIDFDMASMTVGDLIYYNCWDLHKLIDLFGYHSNDIINRLGTIDPYGANHWVWFPKSNTLKITSNVYQFLSNMCILF